MMYTWPFLFSAFIASLVWIFKEREAERALNKIRQDFEDADAAFELKVQRLNLNVFGEDGDNGLRGDVKALTKQVGRLSLAFNVWAAKENIQIPE